MALKKKNTKTGRHLLYEMFNPKGNGKGLTKEEAKLPKNIPNFFKYYFRYFNMMFALNIFAFLGNFPILFGLYALTGNLNTEITSASSSLFSVIYGAFTAGNVKNPVSAALSGVHGIQTTVSVPSKATYVFFALTALVLFTYGFVNLSTAYIMRNIVKGDSVSFFGDVKYSIKRNWKQGLILGILDLVFTFVIAYDILWFYLRSGISALNGFLFGVMLIMAMLYIMMRYYLYIMLVTFDLSIPKIIKNSFIFALLGFKRNITAFLGTVCVALVDYFFLMTFFPIGVILPVMLLVSMVNFMGIYAAYPKVKEVMIDPYYVSDNVGAKTRKEAEEEPEEETEEPIFRDRG